LTHIPDHDAVEAGKALAECDDGSERAGSLVSGSGGAGVTGYPKHDLDVGVQADSLRPVIPSVEVEVVLGASSSGVRLYATVVVVELNPDDIEIDGSSKHGTIGSIGIRALRSGC